MAGSLELDLDDNEGEEECWRCGGHPVVTESGMCQLCREEFETLAEEAVSDMEGGD